MAAAPPILAISDLAVQYNGAPALRDVSLELDAGATLAVIGPNGSGKSTLLRAIAGLVAPSAGSISCTCTRPALVLQSTDVDRSLPITARETIRMARYPGVGIIGRFGRHDRDVVNHAIRLLDLTDVASAQLHDLSGGQRQRVLLAQGLAQESPLLLLDEPITGLDVTARRTVLEIIGTESDAGRAVVMTTHDLDDARAFDQVLLLRDGRPVACGPPDEALREPNLREAFGGHVVRLVDGEVVMDDPHHDH